MSSSVFERLLVIALNKAALCAVPVRGPFARVLLMYGHPHARIREVIADITLLNGFGRFYPF